MNSLKNRLKNTLSENRELLLLVLVLTLGTLALFLPTWLEGNYYVAGGDVKTQTFPFFVMCRNEWISALKNRTLPFYSWYDFLGNNIWASKSRNGLLGIYYFIAYLFPFNFWVTYEIMCYLKILVSGILFYLYLKNRNKDSKWKLLGGICYGLSSYIVYFTSAPYFDSFYSLIPLFFLGIEKYLKDNKLVLFTVAVILLCSCNLYLFYSLSLFTPIYFLYRYYNIHGSLKGWLISALKLIGCYVVGFITTGVIILPAADYLLQNERVGGKGFQLFFEDVKMYLHLLIVSFVPSYSYIYGNNIFNYSSHALKEILIYSGSAVTLVIPQLSVQKNKKHLWSTLIVYLIMMLTLFTSVGGSITNGFSEVSFRWTYIIIFMNVSLAVELLDNRESFSKKLLTGTAILESVLIVLCFVSAVYIEGEQLESYGIQSLIYAITIVFILLTACLLNRNSYRKIIIITISELLLFTSIKGYNSRNTGVSKSDYESVTTVLSDSNYDLDYYLNNLEEGNESEFFRVYVPQGSIYWSFSYNLNKVYGLKGLSTYDSMYAPSFKSMKSMNPDEIKVIIDWQYDITDSGLVDFLSTKYSITTSEEEIPFTEYEILDTTYRGSLIVAKNCGYKPFGRTYTELMTVKEFDNNTELLKTNVVCSENDYETIKEYLVSDTVSDLENIEVYNNSLRGELYSDDKSFMVISLPYDEGWKILVNGEEVTVYKVNGGTMGIPVEAGTNTIEMYFVPKGFKLGALMTATGVIAFIVIIFIDRRKNRV